MITFHMHKSTETKLEYWCVTLQALREWCIEKYYKDWKLVLAEIAENYPDIPNVITEAIAGREIWTHPKQWIPRKTIGICLPVAAWSQSQPNRIVVVGLGTLKLAQDVIITPLTCTASIRKFSHHWAITFYEASHLKT